MTASLNSAMRSVCWLIAGALVAATPAWAQQAPAEPEAGAPVPLGAPIQLLPSELPPVQPAPAQPVPSAPSGIQIDTLAELDPNALGPIDDLSGGLGSLMWQGSERGLIERLFARLPTESESAAVRALARRLLLSAAAPPVELAGPASGASPTAFLAARLEALRALGDTEGMAQLLQAVPRRSDDAAIAQGRVELLLLDGLPEQACQEVRNNLTRFGDSDFWQKAQIACHLQAGEEDQAQFALNLLRESGGADDPELLALVGASDAPLELAGNRPPSVLRFAFSDGALDQVDGDQVAAVAPSLLGALVTAPELDQRTRTLAVERAVTLGYLDPVELAAIYRSFSFDPGELDNALTVAAGLEGPEARALLYQSTQRQALPAVRAEILRVALDSALANGGYVATAAVLEPDLLAIPAVPELGWFAEAAGRALYARGRFEEANRWFTVARLQAGRDQQAAQTAAALWPYAAMAGHPMAPRTGNLATWQAARGLPTELARDDLSLLRGSLEALQQIDPLPWSELAALPSAQTATAPDAAVIHALQDASQDGRRGETVLLALMALGDPGPADGHPLALAASVAALVAIGLPAEAQSLAVEAALARGL
ncbi:MAG: hypothetical protein AAF495_20655 [Pseudomonadota bacterium]